MNVAGMHHSQITSIFYKPEILSVNAIRREQPAFFNPQVVSGKPFLHLINRRNTPPPNKYKSIYLTDKTRTNRTWNWSLFSYLTGSRPCSLFFRKGGNF